MFRTATNKRSIVGMGVAALLSTVAVALLSSFPGEEVSAAPGGSCSTYKEWTYYSNSSHSVVVGSKTRMCTGTLYTEGQQTQYCDWIVTGCPFDADSCPNGVISTGSSNNC